MLYVCCKTDLFCYRPKYICKFRRQPQNGTLKHILLYTIYALLDFQVVNILLFIIVIIVNNCSAMFATIRTFRFACCRFHYTIHAHKNPNSTIQRSACLRTREKPCLLPRQRSIQPRARKLTLIITITPTPPKWLAIEIA